MELVEGWLPKSQPSRTWTLLGGVCALLGSCPKPNKQNYSYGIQRSYLKTKRRKKKVLLISGSSIIIIINSYLHILPNLLRFIPLSKTSDFTLQILPITSRDSDLPPSPIVSGHSSSTFLYSFSAAHPQSPPP